MIFLPSQDCFLDNACKTSNDTPAVLVQDPDIIQLARLWAVCTISYPVCWPFILTGRAGAVKEILNF